MYVSSYYLDVARHERVDELQQIAPKHLGAIFSGRILRRNVLPPQLGIYQGAIEALLRLY